ncbi:hypothetical protein LTR70_001518 [Exophiala xenobiotica]|uniref:Uncharacterized protein n=1 Tax=Lithohypha guttulata TaxID=1690604 RepID=A0ABR0K7B0_9EURO|nr:hypothetical protein LTR24_005962 [Lithohypha guttulata]KAK5327895.1 hypothetical protein LTR70_001518 [Exophiala xenobiotica]
MKIEAERIKTIFQRFYEADRADDFWGFARRARFAIGNSTKELEQLITTIERRADNLDRQVRLMDSKYLQRQVLAIKKPLRGTCKRRNVKILFVDPGNTGRSVVAQGYAQLVREATRTSNKPWFITTIHSAGLYVRNTGPCGLSELQDQINLSILDADRAPSKVAQASLFDNDYFNYPYKSTIRGHLASQRSRGITRTTFRDYDYILVFRLKDNMALQKLRVKIRQTYGAQFVPKEKGKIVMLGEYRDQNSSEIFWPKGPGDSIVPTRKDMDRCMGMIKAGFKGWLRDEIEWERPWKDYADARQAQSQPQPQV